MVAFVEPLDLEFYFAWEVIDIEGFQLGITSLYILELLQFF
jgi:hypothetical protein